jgi:hypothetical protein
MAREPEPGSILLNSFAQNFQLDAGLLHSIGGWHAPLKQSSLSPQSELRAQSFWSVPSVVSSVVSAVVSGTGLLVDDVLFSLLSEHATLMLTQSVSMSKGSSLVILNPWGLYVVRVQSTPHANRGTHKIKNQTLQSHNF